MAFFDRGVILVECQEWGSTPVLMDSWGKLVKIADNSLAANKRKMLDRPSGPEDDFSLRGRNILVRSTSLMKPLGCFHLEGQWSKEVRRKR